MTPSEIKARVKPGMRLMCRTCFENGEKWGWRERVVVRVNEMSFYTIAAMDLGFKGGPRWRHDWPSRSIRARIGGFIIFRSPDRTTYEECLWSDQPPVSLDNIPDWAFKGFRHDGNPRAKHHGK